MQLSIESVIECLTFKAAHQWPDSTQVQNNRTIEYLQEMMTNMKYKHVDVTIDLNDHEQGIKYLLESIGVKWKKENISIEVK